MTTFYGDARVRLEALLPGILLRDVADDPAFPPGRHLVLDHPSGGSPIEVHFHNDEYTLAWNNWHTHENDAEPVAETIRDIMADRVAVFTVQGADGGWLGSQLAQADEDEWLDWVTAPGWRSAAAHFAMSIWTRPRLRVHP